MNLKPTTWRPWKNCWKENEPQVAWKNGICEMGALRNQAQANSAPMIVVAPPPPPHLQQHHHLPPSSPSPFLALGNAQFRDFESLWMPSSHLLVSISAETYTEPQQPKLSCYGGFGVARFSSSSIKPQLLQIKPRLCKTRVSEPSPQQVRASLGLRWRRRCIWFSGFKVGLWH